MKIITQTLLAAAAIGAVSAGNASAMPFVSLSAALGESHADRSAPPYYAPRYYESPPYYDPPGYDAPVE